MMFCHVFRCFSYFCGVFRCFAMIFINIDDFGAVAEQFLAKKNFRCSFRFSEASISNCLCPMPTQYLSTRCAESRDKRAHITVYEMLFGKFEFDSRKQLGAVSLYLTTKNLALFDELSIFVWVVIYNETLTNQQQLTAKLGHIRRKPNET